MKTSNVPNPILHRLLDLMYEHGENAKHVTETLHMSASSFTDWKKGRASPGVEALSKLAPYFGVSLDWLITGHEYEGPLRARDGASSSDVPVRPDGSGTNDSSPSSASTDPMDLALLDKYRRLPPEFRRDLMTYMDGMLVVLSHQSFSQPRPVAPPDPKPEAVVSGPVETGPSDAGSAPSEGPNGEDQQMLA